MKKLTLILTIILSFGILNGCTQKVATDPNKKAILVVSFGTSYADTRALTIEATEQRFREEFPDYDIIRAFTSQTIINILRDRDKIEVYNVKEALEYLKSEKYSEVIIQPLHIINGAEYDELVAEAILYQEYFNKFEIGRPLLTSAEDYFEVVEALKEQVSMLKENEGVVFMGHGTHHHSNAAYTAMEYVFHDMDYKNVFIGTVEGYPQIDQVMSRLKEKNIDKVTLIPFMFVAGDHASNDMAGDEDDSWKTILKKAGYEVEVYLHGLGENTKIQDIYLKHARSAIASAESQEK